MAWHRTVRQRLKDRYKKALRDFFLDELGREGLKVIVGIIRLEGLTDPTLSDTDSLLIKDRAGGNVMCRSTRISRSGIRLQCFQEWPTAHQVC
jgi:hypothetical protein